jgi:F-type H+-transporting ATPase subunit b
MAGEELMLADAAPEGHSSPAAGDAPSDEHMTGTEHDGGAHGAKPGLPQLDTTTFASQLFWLLISFVVLYVVISRVAAPKIGGVIADRTNRIKGDIDAAAQAKAQSEAAIANYERALAEARGRALKVGEEIRATVQAEINAKNDEASRELTAKLQRAEAQVAEMRANAMARVGDMAREAAADIVAKLIGDPGNTADIDNAVAGALKRG